jgi:myo-inositol-hexaphosphate 3-phosphohydrolase
VGIGASVGLLGTGASVGLLLGANVSMGLPTAGDADLIMQVEQKNGHLKVVHLEYILKIVEMNESTVI